MAFDLAATGNQLGAARETRNAALAALRGLAFVSGEQPSNWSETKVVVTALGDPEVATILQIKDTGHIILRVSVDGAVVTARETQDAISAAQSLVTLLREKAESAVQQGPKPVAGG